MLMVWAIGIVAAEWIDMSLMGILTLTLLLVPIIIWKTPRTINRHCYTVKEIRKAKVYATTTLCVCFVMAVIYMEWRSLIMCAVTLEVMTLLPE